MTFLWPLRASMQLSVQHRSANPPESGALACSRAETATC